MTKKSFCFVLCAFLMALMAFPLHAEKLGDIKKNLKKDKINSTNTNTKQPKVTAPKISIENAIKVIQDIKNPKAPSADAQTVQKQFEKGKAAEAKKLKASKDSKKILKAFQGIIPKKIVKNKPAGIGQKKSAPQRIGEPAKAPVSSSIISEKPPSDIYPPKTDDTTEIEGIQAFDEFYAIIKDDSFYQTDGSIGGALELAERVSRMEAIINEACSRYSNFTYLCSMFRYYYSEVFLAAIGTSIDRYGCEGRFDQVADIYSVDSAKNPVCKYVVDKVIVRRDDIRKNVETDSQNTIDKYKAGISNVSAALDALQKETIKYGDYIPTQEEIENAYMVVQYYYSVVAKSYLAMNKYAEAQTAMKDMDDFYNKIPKKYTMKYEDLQTNPDGSETIVVKNKTYELKRDTNEYLSDIKDYIIACGKYCEVGEEGKIIFDDLQEHIAKIENYEKQDNDNIAAELLQYKKEHAGDKDEKARDGFYKNSRKITLLYFTRTENIELTSEDIPEPQDRLALRCQTDGKGPQYKFSIDVKSQVSNRKKSLKMAKDWINGGYYSVFQPNIPGSTSPEDNLIDIETDSADPDPSDGNEPQPPNIPSGTPAMALLEARSTFQHTPGTKAQSQRTISLFQGADKSLTVPAEIYNSDYFDKKLVRSYFRVNEPKPDLKRNVIPNSNKFLFCGGGEFISPDDITIYNEIIHSTVVGRVAKWFVIQGHGSASTSIIGEPIGSDIGVNPVNLCPNENGVSQSRYKGMEVLILDGCYCLTHYKAWKQVLPQGTILGYHGLIGIKWIGYVIKEFAYKLPKKSKLKSLAPSEIGRLWDEANSYVFTNNGGILINRACYYGYIIPKKGSPKSIYCYATPRDEGNRFSIETQEIEF